MVSSGLTAMTARPAQFPFCAKESLHTVRLWWCAILRRYHGWAITWAFPREDSGESCSTAMQESTEAAEWETSEGFRRQNGLSTDALTHSNSPYPRWECSFSKPTPCIDRVGRPVFLLWTRFFVRLLNQAVCREFNSWCDYQLSGRRCYVAASLVVPSDGRHRLRRTFRCGGDCVISERKLFCGCSLPISPIKICLPSSL